MKAGYSDAAAAHALARVGLGINIALHGFTRIPRFAEFKQGLLKDFSASPLPAGLVELSAVGIVAAESVIGVLLLLGLFLRGALIAGGGLIFVLLFGVCLIWNWNAAGSQLIYLAFFTVLLATLSHDRYSLDAWRAKRG